MEFKFKNKTYIIPSLLREITLGQRIEFYKQYGAAIDKAVREIDNITDEFMRDAEAQLLYLKLATESFSFFTGIPLDVVSSEIAVSDIVNIYNANLQVLLQQEHDLNIEESYSFANDEWVIEAPELTAKSNMVFNEFLHAKEIVRQLVSLGSGNWEPLPYLCAIYLRKKGEPFSEELVTDGSERIELMKSLPLDIALTVGFFLTDTMSLYLKTSQSSKVDEEVKDPIQVNTSINGDG